MYYVGSEYADRDMGAVKAFTRWCHVGQAAGGRADYFGRRDQPYMVNFRVDDVDATLAQLRAAGVDVVEKIEESEYGRLGWARDSEGYRFELREPLPGR